MVIQDDIRENQMVELFKLEVPVNRTRNEIDAHLSILGQTVDFELKSSTNSTVSTVRDLGPDHISKWRNEMHWLFAFYDKSGKNIQYCSYGSPAAMDVWVSRMEEYILPDLKLAELAPAKLNMESVEEILGTKTKYELADATKIMKRQWTTEVYKAQQDLPGGYSPERMLEILQFRAKYVILRGSTLNNPHIDKKFLQQLPRIESNYAEELRKLVAAYLSNA